MNTRVQLPSVPAEQRNRQVSLDTVFAPGASRPGSGRRLSAATLLKNAFAVIVTLALSYALLLLTFKAFYDFVSPRMNSDVPSNRLLYGATAICLIAPICAHAHAVMASITLATFRGECVANVSGAVRTLQNVFRAMPAVLLERVRIIVDLVLLFFAGPLLLVLAEKMFAWNALAFGGAIQDTGTVLFVFTMGFLLAFDRHARHRILRALSRAALVAIMMPGLAVMVSKLGFGLQNPPYAVILGITLLVMALVVWHALKAFSPTTKREQSAFVLSLQLVLLGNVLSFVMNGSSDGITGFIANFASPVVESQEPPHRFFNLVLVFVVLRRINAVTILTPHFLNRSESLRSTRPRLLPHQQSIIFAWSIFALIFLANLILDHLVIALKVAFAFEVVAGVLAAVFYARTMAGSMQDAAPFVTSDRGLMAIAAGLSLFG